MKKINSGDIVEITENINAIPRGIYKVLTADEFGVSFSIGKSVYFTVSNHAFDKMKVLPRSTLKRTSNKTFLPQYYNLLHNSQAKDNALFEPKQSYTHCILSPTVAAEYEFH